MAGAANVITPYVSRGYAILHSVCFISSHQELKQSLQYPANVRDHSQPHSLHLSFPSVAESRIRGKMRDMTLAGGVFILALQDGLEDDEHGDTVDDDTSDDAEGVVKLASLIGVHALNDSNPRQGSKTDFMIICESS